MGFPLGVRGEDDEGEEKEGECEPRALQRLQKPGVALRSEASFGVEPNVVNGRWLVQALLYGFYRAAGLPAVGVGRRDQRLSGRYLR